MFTVDLLLASDEDEISEAPDRNIPLEEQEWNPDWNASLSPYGRMALAIRENRWMHAETEHYVLHFRRKTEARKVARELEFNFWHIATTLNAKPDQYSGKGHAFIFEDADDWKVFLEKSQLPPWSDSLAIGDDLYLNVRHTAKVRRFNSGTLAHEASHAVVARLYPNQTWPLWLNEGFAEFMGADSVAARRHRTTKSQLSKLDFATLSLEEITSILTYPEDQELLARFYQSSDRLIRFLMIELPPENFPLFVDAILNGTAFEEAILSVYGENYTDFEKFRDDFNKF